MIAMMFVGMPAAVIGGIAWECRKRSRLAEEVVDHSQLGEGLLEGAIGSVDNIDSTVAKPR